MNKLSLHPKKPVLMTINYPRKQNTLLELSPLYMNNTEIKQVHKTEYLGLTVDESLNWNEQYKCVKGKVVGGVASLRKSKNILPQSQLLDIY